MPSGQLWPETSLGEARRRVCWYLLPTEAGKSGIQSCLGSILRAVGLGQRLKGQERFKWKERVGDWGRTQLVWMQMGIPKSTHPPGSFLIIPFYENPRKILSNAGHSRALASSVQPSGNLPFGKALGGGWGEDYLIGSGYPPPDLITLKWFRTGAQLWVFED